VKKEKGGTHRGGGGKQLRSVSDVEKVKTAEPRRRRVKVVLFHSRWKTVTRQRPSLKKGEEEKKKKRFAGQEGEDLP